MEKKIFRILACIVITYLTIASPWFIANGICATEEINSKFGDTPIIDGYIDTSVQEWNNAYKGEILLDDLPIKLWVMQDDINLYISVQFDLLSGHHSTNEFVALIISNSSSEDKDEFIDARLVQFTNISANEYNYYDYNVSSTDFIIDVVKNGDGAAKLEELTSTYEFSLPIKNNITSGEDAALDFGNGYAFNISYGETPVYPSGIKKSAIVLINIKSVPATAPPIIYIVVYVVSLLVFSITGIFLGFYIYRIFKLKENIKKYRR